MSNKFTNNFSLRKFDYLALIILASLLGIQILTWHYHNQWAPIWDGANYIYTAQDIKDSFHNSYFDGVKSLYTTRGWRPIIFPNISSLTLIFFNGNIRYTVASILYIGALITGIYSYRILRLELDIKNALLGSLFLTSLSWINTYTSLFFAEIFWVAAASGSLFYLLLGIKNGLLKNYSISGFLLGLMTCIRPIETVVLIAPVVLIAFIYLFNKNEISKTSITLYLCQISIVLYALLIKILSQNSAAEEFVLFLLALLFVIKIFSNNSNKKIFLLLIFAEIVSVIWHYPSMHKLFSWAYGTSFGELSKTDQRFTGISFLNILEKLLENYSPVILLILTIASLLLLIKITFNRIRNGNGNGNGNGNKNTIIILTIGIISIIPIIILLSISGTSDPRRIMISIYFLYLGLVYFILRNNLDLRLQSISFIFISFITAVQITAIINNNINPNNSFKILENSLIGPLNRPNSSEDGNQILLKKLDSLGLKKGSVGVFTLCTISPRDNCEQYNIPWFEPFALSIVARENHSGLSIGTFLDVDYSNPDTIASQIKSRGFNYVAVDMFNKAIYKNHPIATPTEELIGLINSSSMPKGMTLLDCLWMGRPVCVLSID